MRPRLKVSRAGVELIKSFEGLRQTASQLPDGRWTMGYGHTFSAREGAKVTPDDAESLLRFDLLPVVDAVNNLVMVPLNQNQFDALVSFCFNIGVENFAQSSVVKRINEGRLSEAAVAMDSWRSAEYNGQTYVLAPLIRRRAAEKSLFLTPEEVVTASPSMVMRPIEDTEALPVVESLDMVPQHTLQPQNLPPIAAPTPEAVKPVVVRMADVAPAAPEPAFSLSATPAEPQASPDILAALQKAQAELAAKEEETRRINEALERERALRAELERLENERRSREMADTQRLENERLERERYEAFQRQEAERQEMQRQEEMRLEAARAEEQRLEMARLEAQRQAEEQALLEQQRFEQQRLEQARIEQARLEQEQREAALQEQIRQEQARQEQARLEQERLERERLEALKAQAPAIDEAEAARKAEAAAALMRYYSPYAAGSRPAPQPVAPTAEPTSPFESGVSDAVSEPIAVAPEPVLARPQDAPQIINPYATVETEAEEYEDEEFDYTPHMGSPSNLPPPVVTALNPYRRDPEAAPVVAPVVAPIAAPSGPLDDGLHWRERLNRPVVSDAAHSTPNEAAYVSPARSIEPEERSFEAVAPQAATHFAPQTADSMSGHDLPEGVIVEESHWWRDLLSTLQWILGSALGMAFIGMAIAAHLKGRDSTAVASGGIEADLPVFAIVLAAIGLLFTVISIVMIVRRLKRLS